MEQRETLLTGKKKVGIWGVGHIGYTTMSHFAERGVRCIGYDVDTSKVATINRGECPIVEMQYWLGFDPSYLYRQGAARATNDWKELLDESVAVHFVCIPTERDGQPFLEPLMDVCGKLSTSKGNGTARPLLVIVESTLTPGTLDRHVIPFFEDRGLQVGQDILIGCAPRRDWFATPERSLRTLTRVYGGTDAATTDAMEDVLSIVCQNLAQAPNHFYAEAVKSVENAYRQLDIALAFELSRAFPSVDVRKVLELVGTKWNMETYFPSLGIGGYCIPLSSHYVLEGAEHPEELKLLKEAIQASEKQSLLVARALLNRGMQHVGFLGLSYAENVKLHAQSPTLKIGTHLVQAGVRVAVHDPYYTPEEIVQIAGVPSFAYPEDLRQFDAVLVVAGHREYGATNHETLLKELANCKLIIDNSGIWRDIDFAPQGIEYHVAGDASWLNAR